MVLQHSTPIRNQQQHSSAVGASANKHLLSALHSHCGSSNPRALTLASSLASQQPQEIALSSLGRNHNTNNNHGRNVASSSNGAAAASYHHRAMINVNNNNSNQSSHQSQASTSSRGLNLSNNNTSNSSSSSSPVSSNAIGSGASMLGTCQSFSSSQSSIGSDSLASCQSHNNHNAHNHNHTSLDHDQHQHIFQTNNQSQPFPLNQNQHQPISGSSSPVSPSSNGPNSNRQTSANNSVQSTSSGQTTATSATSTSPQHQSQQQQQQQNSSRYKTELCRPFEENGTCKYGEKCQFAHGLPELRTLARHPKYKTEFCRTFHTTGFCPYGPRCHFIHNGRGPAPNMQSASASLAASLANHQQQLARQDSSQQNEPIGAQLPIINSKDQLEVQQHQVRGLLAASSNSPSSSPVSSAQSVNSVSSCSSSSGKGSSLCSPPSCSNSPPALSSSPDSSMLGSSSVSSSPNHHHTHHQFQQLSIGRRSILPFACSLSEQLDQLTSVQAHTQRDAPGLTLAGTAGSPFFSALSGVGKLGEGLQCKTIGSDRESNSASSASNESSRDVTCDSSHAFLWLHSQLNSGQSTPVQSISPLNNSLNLESADSNRDSNSKQPMEEQASKQSGDTSGARWPLCSGLAMSPSSVAAARRTWQMQA